MAAVGAVTTAAKSSTEATAPQTIPLADLDCAWLALFFRKVQGKDFAVSIFYAETLQSPLHEFLNLRDELRPEKVVLQFSIRSIFLQGV